MHTTGKFDWTCRLKNSPVLIHFEATLLCIRGGKISAMLHDRFDIAYAFTEMMLEVSLIGWGNRPTREKGMKTVP